MKTKWAVCDDEELVEYVVDDETGEMSEYLPDHEEFMRFGRPTDLTRLQQTRR